MHESWRALRYEYRAIGRLAGPIIVGQVAQIATGFTDTVMAGRLGAIDLAAVAVGANLWIPVYLFALGLMMAVSSLVARYHAARRFSTIRDLVRQSLPIVAVLSAFSVMLLYSLPGLLGRLALNPQIMPIVGDYLAAVAWGFPAAIAYLGLRFLSEGLGYTRPMMVIQLVALGLNVLGNWILMYGKFGAPALGAVGAGWSTAIVMWCNLLMLLAWIALHRRYRVIWQAAMPAMNWSQGRALLRLGLPVAVALLSEVGLFAAVALLMGRLGVIEVAAHQVAVSISGLAFMFPLGIATATTVRVAQAIGGGDYPQARLRGLAGISLGVFCALVSATLMVTVPGALAGFYSTDTRVIDLAVRLLLMAALFQFSDAVQVTSAGALRGLPDTLVPMLITLVVYWMIGLPLAYYLGFVRQFGPEGLWLGLIAGLTLAAIWLVWRFLRQVRIQSRSS